MQSSAPFFSSSYAEARHKFVEAVRAKGLAHQAYVHPTAKGPQGEGLFMDAAWQGPAAPRVVLLIASATHGIEGYVGSAGQTSLLTSGVCDQLPPDVGVLYVHAVNPHGFAHGRRVNEDNIDLNRNFVDFTAPLPPEDPLTEELNALLLPEDWDGAGKAKMDQALDLFVAQYGLRAFQNALTRGQYRFPRSPYFGGSAPSWSNTTFRAIVQRYCAHKPLVVHLDLHSGLGPYGYGELIYSDPRSTLGFARASQWWGQDVTCSVDGSSTSIPLTGDIEQAIKAVVGFDKTVSITLEFGTVPLRDMLSSLIADNWLHVKGQQGTPLAAQIKRQIRYCFYGEEPVWQSMTLGRIHDVVERAMAGLKHVDLDAAA